MTPRAGRLFLFLLPTLACLASAFNPSSSSLLPRRAHTSNLNTRHVPNFAVLPGKISYLPFAQRARLEPLRTVPEVAAPFEVSSSEANPELVDRLGELVALANETATVGWALSQEDSSGARDRDGTWVTRNNPRLEP